MANTKSKIERLGLANNVQDMIRSGIVTGKQICEILRSEGHKISSSSVNRYLKDVRGSITPTAFKIVQDHVEKVIPEDLTALESMEALLLKWAGEDPKDAADRIANARLMIEGEIDRWAAMIANADSTTLRPKAIKAIVRTCLSYFMIDARMQNKRIQAMQTAVKIIELKLRNAGLLDDDTDGRVIIMDSSTDYAPPDDPSRRRPYTVKTEDGNG